MIGKSQRRPDGIVGSEAELFKRALGEWRKALPILIAFGFFINLLYLTSPIYMMQMYDRVISSGRVETLIALTLAAGIALLFMGALEGARTMVLARLNTWLERKLAADLIGAATRAALMGMPANAQPLRDLATIRSFVGGTSVLALCDLPWMPAFLVVVWLIHPVLGMVGLGAAVLIYAIAVINNFASRQGLKEASRMATVNQQKADVVVRNADVLHSMGMMPAFLGSWVERNNQGLEIQIKATDIHAFFFGLTRFLRAFVQILIMGVAAYLILNRELTGGGMIACSMMLGRALAPVEQSIGAWHVFLQAREAYDRLVRYLEAIPQANAAMPLPAPKGRVTCEQVFYTPPRQKEPILNGVTFALEPGEALGVIGPSASGKSTLCRVLVGISRPSSGNARLDGADIFVWPPEQRGRYVGYLPQDIELFDDTVKSNIARLNPDPDPAEVVDAARTAGVHEMILRLPQGYETRIGEGGSRLSGGQRQRIGLARALYGRPRFIVLDEPNASLDNEGELALIQAIETAKAWGATVVLVAHQAHILKPVDKLLVMRNGRVEIFGRRDDVMNNVRTLRNPAEGRPRAIPNAPTPPVGSAGNQSRP